MNNVHGVVFAVLLSLAGCVGPEGPPGIQGERGLPGVNGQGLSKVLECSRRIQLVEPNTPFERSVVDVTYTYYLFADNSSMSTCEAYMMRAPDIAHSMEMYRSTDPRVGNAPCTAKLDVGDGISGTTNGGRWEFQLGGVGSVIARVTYFDLTSQYNGLMTEFNCSLRQ